MNEVIVTNAHHQKMISKRETVNTAKGVLKDEGRSSSSVSIVFVDDSFSRKLNRTYLDHDYATDVLAFPLGSGKNVEGEIYVNLDRAKVQAREEGVSFENETTRLVIHGLLHLLGYRDSTERLKQQMSKKEDKYIEKYHNRNGHAR